MCTKAMSPLRVISFVLLITAVLLVSAGPASAVSNVPDYRGDDNSVHAVFDWVSNPHIPWDTTLFETGFSIYSLDPTVPAASDDGLNTVIDLPNFIDPLSFKLMRIRMFFDGPVSGELISAQVTAFDPEGPTLVSRVGSSGPGPAVEHYIDFEIFPNPDREQITILGDTSANIIPGNLRQIEIDTVSLPEPATLALLMIGGLAMLRRRRGSVSRKCAGAAVILTVVALLTSSGLAGVIVYSQDLAGFNAAAGSPPIAIDFDSITPGTDITGWTLAGATLQGPGAPLIVVLGSDTQTPGTGFTRTPNPGANTLIPTTGDNLLSPGGPELLPGPNDSVENDDLTVVFSQPVSAFGLDFLWQSSDGASFTFITVYDTDNVQLHYGAVPSTDIAGDGGPGGSDFWGIVSDSQNIAKYVIDETDGNAEKPDSNIGFDTFRFVPEPGILGLLLLGGLALLRRRR